MTHTVLAARDTVTFIEFKPEEYSAEDLEHISITVLFLGGGLVSSVLDRLFASFY